MILVGFGKFQPKISKYMSKRIFFLFSEPCSRDCDLKIRDWVSARMLENHLRIPSRGYLKVQRIFQNFNFQFFSTSMKFPKKSKKFSSWSKKSKLHIKLNDGSPGYWEKYSGFSDMFLRHLNMHLKIFLEAHFWQLLELFKFSKNHCHQILWNFELKLLRKKLRGSDYMMCNWHHDPTISWFFNSGRAFVSGHTVFP